MSAGHLWMDLGRGHLENLPQRRRDSRGRIPTFPVMRLRCGVGVYTCIFTVSVVTGARACVCQG